VTLTHSTISGNSAFLGGGGGIFNGDGPLTLTNSTVSGNSVGLSGGGIFNRDGTLTLTHSTVSENVAGAADGGGGGIFSIGGLVTLAHTVVAGNTTESDSDCSGSLTSLGHNLVGEGTGCPSDGPGDLTVNPAEVFATVLDPLENNGGPTQTQALLPGSPAIDAGAPVCTDADGLPLTTDQRGVTRPQGVACDIGAYEFLPVVVIVDNTEELLANTEAPAIPGASGDGMIAALHKALDWLSRVEEEQAAGEIKTVEKNLRKAQAQLEKYLNVLTKEKTAVEPEVAALLHADAEAIIAQINAEIAGG
jgi:hypothetical protein